MIIINTVSDSYFSYNGINHAKIYQPLKQGLEAISIVNVFDTRQKLNNSEIYDQYNIDGTIYGSQALAIEAMLPVIYNQILFPSSLIEGSGTEDFIPKFTSINEIADSIMKEILSGGGSEGGVFSELITSEYQIAFLSATKIALSYSVGNVFYGMIVELSGSDIILGSIYELATIPSSGNFRSSLAGLTDSTFVLLHDNTTDTFIKFDVSGTVITPNETGVNGITTYRIVRLTDTTFVSIKNFGSPTELIFNLNEITGGAITVGSDNDINIESLNTANIERLTDTNIVVITHENVHLVSISGTSFTKEDTVAIAQTTAKGRDIKRLSDTKFIATYYNNGYKAVIGTISGSAITLGTEYEISSDLVVTEQDSESLISILSDTKVVASYVYASAGYSKVMNISGTVITFGDEYEFASDISGFISAKAFNNSEFIVFYGDNEGTKDNVGTYLKGVVVGDVITFGSTSLGVIAPKENLLYDLGSEELNLLWRKINGRDIRAINLVADNINVSEDEVAVGSATGMTSSEKLKWINDVLEVLGSINLGGVAANRLILPLNNDAASPTLAFGNSGFYKKVDNVIILSLNGTQSIMFESARLRSADYGRGFSLRNVDSTSTNPVYAFVDAETCGLGKDAAKTNEFSLIADNTEVVKIGPLGILINGDLTLTDEEAFGDDWEDSYLVPIRKDIFDALDLLAGFAYAISDEEKALTTGIKVTFWAEYKADIKDVIIDATVAPTGSILIVDIHVNGVSILSTKATIDAGENTSQTAATQPVISDPVIEKGDKVEYIIDQIGSTIAGAGVKVKPMGNKVL